MANGELRRMDLVTIDHSLDGRLVDPTVVDPATPAEVARAAVAPVAMPSRVVDDAKAVKEAHFPDLPAGFTMHPVGLDNADGRRG